MGIAIREVYKDDFFEQYEIRHAAQVMFLHRVRLGVPGPEGKCLVTSNTLFVNGVEWRRMTTYKEQLGATDKQTVEDLILEWEREQRPRVHVWERA